MNILLTQSKTNTLNEVIKLNPQDNIHQIGNAENPSFVDVLFSDQRKIDNINSIEEDSTDQINHNPPILAESQQSDDPFIQKSSGSKQTFTDYSNYDERKYDDINDGSGHFNFQDDLSKSTVDESNTSNIKDQNIESDIITSLEKLLSKEDIKLKEPKLFVMLKKVLAVMRQVEAHSSNSDVMKNLRESLSFENDQSKGIKTKVIKELADLMSSDTNNLGNQEVIAKLDAILSVIDGKKGKGVKSDKNPELASNKGFLKNIVEKLIDRFSKSTEDVYLENETTVDSRLTKDRNNADTPNSDRDIRIEQKVTVAQSTKNSLTEQHQNKNKFAQLSKKEKDDNSKLQRIEANNQIINDKTQNVFRPSTNGLVSKSSTHTRTISQSQLGEMVVRGARQFKKGGNSEIHLTIKKPDLGNIKISFVENGKGKLEVFIVAERYEASELIKQNSAEIKQLLMQEGIDLSKFDVHDSYNKNKRYFAQGNGFQKNNRRNPSKEDSGSTNPGETLAGNDDMIIQSNGVASNQQVNLIV